MIDDSCLATEIYKTYYNQIFVGTSDCLHFRGDTLCQMVECGLFSIVYFDKLSIKGEMTDLLAFEALDQFFRQQPMEKDEFLHWFRANKLNNEKDFELFVGYILTKYAGCKLGDIPFFNGIDNEYKNYVLHAHRVINARCVEKGMFDNLTINTPIRVDDDTLALNIVHDHSENEYVTYQRRYCQEKADEQKEKGMIKTKTKKKKHVVNLMINLNGGFIKEKRCGL